MGGSSSKEKDLAKLELVHVGAVEVVGSLASIHGCRVSSLPMNYMGLPFGVHVRQNLFEWYY